MDKYYYRKDKKTIGPLSWTELESLFNSGEIQETTKVAKDGDPSWSEFSKLRAVVSLSPSESTDESPNEAIKPGVSWKTRIAIGLGTIAFVTITMRACSEDSQPAPVIEVDTLAEQKSLDSIRIAKQAELLAAQIVDSIQREKAQKEMDIAQLIGYWDCDPEETADPYTIQMNADGTYAILMEENEIAGTWVYLENAKAFRLKDTEGFMDSDAHIRNEQGTLLLILQRNGQTWSFKKHSPDEQ